MYVCITPVHAGIFIPLTFVSVYLRGSHACLCIYVSSLRVNLPRYIDTQRTDIDTLARMRIMSHMHVPVYLYHSHAVLYFTVIAYISISLACVPMYVSLSCVPVCLYNLRASLCVYINSARAFVPTSLAYMHLRLYN